MKSFNTLNYIELPIGAAISHLKGDLVRNDNNIDELKKVRDRWTWADRYFRRKARRLGKRPWGIKALGIIGINTYEEYYLQVLKCAKESLKNFDVPLEYKRNYK